MVKQHPKPTVSANPPRSRRSVIADPRPGIVSLGISALLLLGGASHVDAAEYQWPAYSPNIAYDFNEDFGPLDPPTKILPGVSGVDGVYADGWWCFVWGANKNPQVTENAWIPMIQRFNRDFAYMTDVLGWPRDKRAQNGYYSTVYLFGSGLSTDNADNTTPGGWMGTTGWNGEPWHNVLASYIPVRSFDPAYADGYQTGAMIHEGIHSIFANMPGGYNSAWGHESFNVWLQSTMEAQRNGSFSGMGGLSAGSQIAPFIPIECYSGWLQDGSFGGPGGQGVNKADANGQICTWRHILGGYQYGEAFPHALAVILGPKSIPWIWNNSDESGYLLQDMALAPGGLGDAQARRVIQEYRGRQAFCDFKQWSHAFRQLLHNYWGAVVQEEWAPYDVDVDPWTMTCYVATTNNGGELTPEARTLPGWSGANQIPLTVDPSATNVSVTFNPIGANMSCQLVYRDTNGAIHYSDPVASGVCTLPVANVRNNVVVAVVCNTDYIYEGEQTRTAKFDYRLTIGSGITGTADIHTKWWDYNPGTYTIAASAGANGSIHPSGAVVVNNGAVQTFTFAPAPGYKVGDVLLNGLTVGAPTSYTLNPVLSDNSLQVVFRDAVPPSAPIGLSASVVNGSIHIDWADNSEPDLATYNVYRATTGGGEYSPIARGVSASTFTDHVVVDGTTYHYVISAVDAESNESVFSAEVPATAIDTLAPAAPAGLVVEGTGATAFLNWADNGEPDLAGYTVLRSSTSGGGYAVIASGLTSSDYVDASVTPGATYFYVVTAGDLSGNQSGNSAETTVVSKVLARWDFNDPSLGAANGATVPSSSTFPTYIWRVAAYDKSGKGNDITTSGGNSSFNWSSNSQDGDFSIKSAGTTPSAFTRSDRSGVSVANDVEKFNGAAFTVEAVATISGDNTFRTVVGREARYLSTLDPNFGSLYLGLDGENRARFLYVDVNGKYIELKSSSTYAADDNVFHHFAASTDGSTVSLHVDGVLVAQATGAGMAGLGIGDSGSGYRPGAWCVGRGLYAGGGSDRWHGYIDSVSITGLALEPGTFVLSNAGPIDAAPAAPSGLTATPGDGIVALDWADNTESDLAGYTVYRSATPGSGYAPIRVGLTTSAYTDPSAGNGTTYHYAVTASDTAFKESDFSADASAMPVDVTPPAAPAGFSATSGNGSIALYWNHNTEPDFVSYTVYRSTTSGSGYVAIASGLTASAYVDNTVANGVTYYYVVTALDTSVLESANSTEAVASSSSSMIVTGTVVGSSGAYGGSGNTRDKVFDGNIGTFFDAVNPSGDWAGLDLGSSETITMVKYCPRAGWASRMVGGMFQGSNNASFSSGVVTLFTIGVSPAEGVLTQQVISNPGAYRYVRYIGPNGGYCNVAEVEFHTAAEADTTAPAVPTGLTATGGDAKVSLDWDDNGDPDLAGYIVYRSNTSGGGYAMIASGLVASAYTDNSAANGSTYYYRVSPKDYSSNESAAGVEVSATASDVTAPLAPTGLMAVFIDGTVSLNWDDNLEHDLAGYTVYRSTTSGGGYAAIASNLTTSAYVDDSTDSETTYFYVVTARDLENNESANSAQVSVTTPEVDGVVSFSTDVPAVGDGVQNLDTSTNDATNTQHQYVPSDYIGTEYRGDNLQMAQSFTTGSNAAAFALNAVSVRQVGWGPTDWDYDGGSITVRIFDLSAAGPGSVWYATEMASRTVFLHGTGTPVVNGTPSAPKWLTFTFSDPVLLAPDRMYAFAIGATGGVSNQEFFMNLDGTATDSYADGFSLSVPDDSAAMWDGGNGRPSDRTFVAAMTAVSYQVPLVNPGFEQPAAGKISNGFDGTTDVPGWSDYGAMTDSGIESPAFVAHSGDYAAYLKAGDGGAWQMTGYTIQEGDVITVGYWARIDWADSPCDATVVVFRDTPDSPEHVIGSSPAALTGTWTYFEYTVTATAASAGQELGIEFKNTQTDWAAIDDVTLTVDRVAAPPAAPTGLAATAGDGSVDLDWDDNSEPNFASYKVYRSSTSGSGYAEIATGLTASVYTDATAVSGTTYHYAVSAVDSAMNESPLSSEASATPMTPAQSWRMAHFETLDNTGDAADGADPEKDGISNLLERAFGGDPNEPDTQILPRVDPTMPALSMIYQFSLDATDLTIFVQENAVLQGAWSPAAGSSGIIGVSGGIRTMRFTRPAGSDDAVFLRVGVSGP